MASIRIAGKVHDSIVDGPGLRYTLFVQGCPHHCEGCHNPETHPFDGGTETTTDLIIEDIKSNPLIKGLTFSGGEPMSHAEELVEIAGYAKSRGFNIWIYSGWTYEEIISGFVGNPYCEKLLSLCDVLVDGRFELPLKSLILKWRGSSNQRLIDLNETRKAGQIVVYKAQDTYSDITRARWG